MPPEIGAAVAEALDRLAPEGALGLAVSGGGDSTALLHATASWARVRARPLLVATVDHGLRPDSAAEAEAVARIAAALGLRHRTLRAPGLRPGNRAARAREARLSLLAAWAAEEGLAAILLGHTLDDQAETVLMRLGRGSGADGLSGMAEASRLLGVLWLRPLLGLRRAALRSWLAARGISWIDDPTNEDESQQRVRIRRVLPALEAAGVSPERIAASATRLARQRAVLEAATDAAAARCLHPAPGGAVWLAPPPLAAEAGEIALRVLDRAIRALTGADYAPRGDALRALVESLVASPPRAGSLGGALARPARRGLVLLCREPAAVDPPAAIGPGGAVWDRRWRIGPLPGGAATIGALGAADARRLAPAMRPEGWESMPHAVRLGLPAIRREGRLVGLALAPERPDEAPELPIAEDLARARLLSPAERA